MNDDKTTPSEVAATTFARRETLRFFVSVLQTILSYADERRLRPP